MVQLECSVVKVMGRAKAIADLTDGAPSFVAVHVGAGYHAPTKEGAYHDAMKAAVKAAQQQLAQHAAALDAVAAAIAVLEVGPRQLHTPQRVGTSLLCRNCTQSGDRHGLASTLQLQHETQASNSTLLLMQGCGVANAGCGSNLNRQGAVECDASVMSGSGSFGAVGAAPGKCHLNTMWQAQLKATQCVVIPTHIDALSHWSFLCDSFTVNHLLLPCHAITLGPSSAFVGCGSTWRG
jgi:hypothetical protein